MNVVDINNLKQALAENNAHLAENLPSSEIEVSAQTGNALSLKEDGLYLPDVSSSLDEISELIDNIELGYATGSYSYNINEETKVSKTITIPMNLNFVPNMVFVNFVADAGTTGGYRVYASDFYISSLTTNSISRIYYDTNCDSDTSFTLNGVRISIKNFSKESITLLVESYKATASTDSIGTNANVYVSFIIRSWFAI